MRKIVNTREQFENIGYDLNFEKPLEVIVKPFRAKRSLDQNAKMHVMIRELADHIGYSQTELKDYLKSEYGPTKTIQIGDKQRVIPMSTAEYNRAEAAEIIEILYMLGAECGYAFQEPANAEGSNGRGARGSLHA